MANKKLLTTQLVFLSVDDFIGRIWCITTHHI